MARITGKASGKRNKPGSDAYKKAKKNSAARVRLGTEIDYEKKKGRRAHPLKELALDLHNLNAVDDARTRARKKKSARKRKK